VESDCNNAAVKKKKNLDGKNWNNPENKNNRKGAKSGKNRTTGQNSAPDRLRGDLGGGQGFC